MGWVLCYAFVTSCMSAFRAVYAVQIYKIGYFPARKCVFAHVVDRNL